MPPSDPPAPDRSPAATDPAAVGLAALDRAAAADLAGALALLRPALAVRRPDDALIEALTGLGDCPEARQRCTAGKHLIELQISTLEALRPGPLRTGLLLSVAELECAQREPVWAAAWVKRAMTEAPGDPRPWDLLDLLLDAYPKMPVDGRTKEQLRALRDAQRGPTAADLEDEDAEITLVDVNPDDVYWEGWDGSLPDQGLGPLRPDGSAAGPRR
ncbi:MAG: hypothetical protein JNM72_05070 [Deltaproteobacteria bacterium]|nr:hypothetical protein [Deltaproteobacteria bacterium]